MELSSDDTGAAGVRVCGCAGVRVCGCAAGVRQVVRNVNFDFRDLSILERRAEKYFLSFRKGKNLKIINHKHTTHPCRTRSAPREFASSLDPDAMQRNRIARVHDVSIFGKRCRKIFLTFRITNTTAQIVPLRNRAPHHASSRVHEILQSNPSAKQNEIILTVNIFDLT